MYVLFLNLKKTFDSVHTEKKKEVCEWLVKVIEEIYKKTINQ